MLANKSVVEGNFPEFEELVMYRNQETLYPVEWVLLPTPSGGMVLGRKRIETSEARLMADQMTPGYSAADTEAGDRSIPTTPDLSRPVTQVETQEQTDAAPSASHDAQSPQVTSNGGDNSPDENNPNQQEDTEPSGGDGDAAAGASNNAPVTPESHLQHSSRNNHHGIPKAASDYAGDSSEDESSGGVKLYGDRGIKYREYRAFVLKVHYRAHFWHTQPL
jgi:hypothetical protein